MKAVLLTLLAAAFASAPAFAADSATQPTASGDYKAKASEVMAYFQKAFWDDGRSVYLNTSAAKDRKPDYIWRQAAAFAAVTAAARHEPKLYAPILSRHFRGMEAYWDSKVAIPAYEPAPTRGNGNDKYYDDNAWMVISLCEAYDQTHDPAYLARARQVAQFVASGWDDQLGGGIWWHQLHKDNSKNTCANGPAAVGYLRLARLVPPAEGDKWATAAEKVVTWTQQKLQASDGLYDDRIKVDSGQVMHGKLTYNAALMLRANLELYRRTKEPKYLDKAERIAKAADWFTDKRTGVYRDPLKFSQFMVEADIDLYRTTGDDYLLRRARTNADAYYEAWKKQPSTEMMSNAGTARMLWLLADLEDARH